MEKGKPGRKRKLAQLSEDDYKQISLWAGDGLNESQIATLLNVNISTITREKKRNEQFAHAIKKGRYKAVQLVAMNIGRNAALRAGLPVTVSGMTIDRQCSSGLMARWVFH